LSSRVLLALGLLLALFILGWLTWQGVSSRSHVSELPAPAINKQSIAFASPTFDPAAPPADMPPLSEGEAAECDSDFRSSASVRGESRQTDATHATVTISQIRVTLQLNINIWVPAGATQRIIEHEDGHRQISEFYYQTADKLAQRIAASFLGKQIEISGTDLGAASSSMLQKTAAEFTDEYNKQLNPGPTQLLYDSITDHGRNDVRVQDAVARALKDASLESPQSTTIPVH